MSKRYNLLISNPEVIKRLDSLPERSKGAYITEAILLKMANDENRLMPQIDTGKLLHSLEQRVARLEKEIGDLKKLKM